MEHIWTAAISAGGIGAVGAFVFYSLYKGWLHLDIFEKVSAHHTYRLMIMFLGFTFLFAIAALVSYAFHKKAPVAQVIYPPLTLQQLKDASYAEGQDGSQIKLSDGFYEKKETLIQVPSEPVRRPDPEPITYTRTVTLDGWVFGDINGDGSEDAVVSLGINTGGTGISKELVPVLNRGGVPDGTSESTSFGDRSTFLGGSIHNQIITVNLQIPQEGDPACCPSRKVEMNYKFLGLRLVCVDESCREIEKDLDGR